MSWLRLHRLRWVTLRRSSGDASVIPAIASFPIFQFLWVWDDLLVSLTFSGGMELALC